MSWSITLHGPKHVVIKELTDAREILESLAAHLGGKDIEPKETVSASANGYVSWNNDTGEILQSSTGHSLSIAPAATDPALPAQ